jgi:putative CocE/NonD family hydrolase
VPAARYDDEWIPLPAGIRLAARIWRPSKAEPTPAILEYLPYRQGDGTWPRDEPIGAWFADHGYAYVRIDIRGTGNSDGVITDEYSQAELDDGVAVIAWIAAQTWCTGSIGMIGISWGGFNGLQLAARRPPALKAVISLCSTDDRYADDVHYDGGCLLNWDMLPWAAITFAMNALPPDPDVVGERWREQWLDRLRETPPFSLTWLAHQRRDAYWEHGSVCADYADIDCPVYLVGGWADGYTNAIPRLLAGLPGVRKALIGPWPHDWPHDAEQGPRIGFLTECQRWFDRWLMDVPNGIEREPRLAAWLQEPAGPAELALDRPGRWVRASTWPPEGTAATPWLLAGDPLRLVLDLPAGDESAPPHVVAHRGHQRHGLLAGTWCPYGPAADYPPDQREDDALCLVLDSEPLTTRLELLGQPVLHLRIRADEPSALVVARLCDVAPDGTSTLISRGALNLTHRDGHAGPAALAPGQWYDVDIAMDVLGQAVPAGHRLRLALSTTYWPWLWPSPKAVTMEVECGVASQLLLPVRSPTAEDGPDPGFGPPEQLAKLPVTMLRDDDAFHVIERDLLSGRVRMRINQDGDRLVRLPNGIELGDLNRDVYDIVEGDPLSASVTCSRELTWRKGAVEVAINTQSRLRSTEDAFVLLEDIVVREGAGIVFERHWHEEIPRDHV